MCNSNVGDVRIGSGAEIAASCCAPACRRGPAIVGTNRDDPARALRDFAHSAQSSQRTLRAGATSSANKSGRVPDARLRDAAGCHRAKALRPDRKRDLVSECTISLQTILEVIAAAYRSRRCRGFLACEAQMYNRNEYQSHECNLCHRPLSERRLTSYAGPAQDGFGSILSLWLSCQPGSVQPGTGRQALIRVRRNNSTSPPMRWAASKRIPQLTICVGQVPDLAHGDLDATDRSGPLLLLQRARYLSGVLAARCSTPAERCCNQALVLGAEGAEVEVDLAGDGLVALPECAGAGPAALL